MISKENIEDLLKVRADGNFHHRESQTLEFKESFNLAGLAEYLRDFAAFANNKGGWLIFGVKDKPRELVGLNANSAKQFNEIDPEKISGFILEIFSSDIQWEHDVVTLNGMMFGAFYIQEAKYKPIISKKDAKEKIKSGEIYYRYGGRTEKIHSAELEQIINHRIEQQNAHWMDMLSKISKSGPQNAAILDLKDGTISKESKVLVVDEKLLEKINWIKEGSFDEKDGSPTLKLIGDVRPMQAMGIIKREKTDWLQEYPLSGLELAQRIMDKAGIGKNEVWRIIRENNIKENPEFSFLNFRNNRQKEQYEKKGILPNGVPYIYKESTVDLIIGIYQSKKEVGK